MKTNIEVTYWQGQDTSYNEYNKLCLYWGGGAVAPSAPPFLLLWRLVCMWIGSSIIMKNHLRIGHWLVTYTITKYIFMAVIQVCFSQ